MSRTSAIQTTLITHKQGEKTVADNRTSPERILDEVGADQIITLIGNGARLRTHGNSQEKGVLNTLNVTEQEFIHWMSSQDHDVQLKYAEAMQISGSNIMTDVLYSSIDVIKEMDEMISSIGDRGPTKTEVWKLKLLESKHKAATDTLRQLTQIQKIKSESARAAPDTAQIQHSQPAANVVVSDEQREKLERYKRDE